MITLNRHAATVIYLLFPYQVTQLLNLLRVLYKDRTFIVCMEGCIHY